MKSKTRNTAVVAVLLLGCWTSGTWADTKLGVKIYPPQGETPAQLIMERDAAYVIVKAQKIIGERYSANVTDFDEVGFMLFPEKISVAFLGSKKFPNYELHFRRADLELISITNGL